MSTRLVPLYLAADKMSIVDVILLLKELGKNIDGVKAHSLCDEWGAPQTCKLLRLAGAQKVWVDFKWHDTPDTVAERSLVMRNAGVDMVTVHASGGLEMMQAAVKNGPPYILAVTVLTSLAPDAVQRIYGETPQEKVLNLALLAKSAGVHGIVCSALEVAMLAAHSELKGLDFVVPGTRSAGKDMNDQKRSATPGETCRNGATGLVIGRQVTAADNRLGELMKIRAEIESALEQ